MKNVNLPKLRKCIEKKREIVKGFARVFEDQGVFDHADKLYHEVDAFDLVLDLMDRPAALEALYDLYFEPRYEEED